MKKSSFRFRGLVNLELVKGCPTDYNGDGQDNDDYNGDGVTDQDDSDYYDGYMDGYYGGSNSDNLDENGEESDAYGAGVLDGSDDRDNDTWFGHPDIDEGEDDVNGGY